MWQCCPEPVRMRAGVGFCVTGSPSSLCTPEQESHLSAGLEKEQLRDFCKGFPMN